MYGKEGDSHKYKTSVSKKMQFKRTTHYQIFYMTMNISIQVENSFLGSIHVPLLKLKMPFIQNFNLLLWKNCSLCYVIRIFEEALRY